MKLLLFCMVCFIAIESADARDPIQVLFEAPKKLPQTTEGWIAFMKALAGEPSIKSTSKFHHGHALGFYLTIDTEKISVSRWIGITDNHLKELSSVTEIADSAILGEIGVLGIELKEIMPTPPHTCNEEGCIYEIQGPCSDIGCEQATVQTNSEGIASIRWRFPID